MIENNIKLKLINLIEKGVVSLLIANNFVEHTGEDLSWDSVILKDKTLELLNIVDSKNHDNEKLINELMEIFPKHQLDSKRALEKRYEHFQRKSTLKNITDQEIIEAASHWVADKGPTYCGNLFYFFFKEDKKIYTSRLENIIKQSREIALNRVDISNPETKIDWSKIE